MAGYRFCRSDDVELLVEAYNLCYAPHFPDVSPLTAAGYKRLVREVDLWASSCMVAIEDRVPAAVMYGAKRDDENCILAIGVRPDRLRYGHAGHMLQSLAQKLTILGPPRMIAELPTDLLVAHQLFGSVGYRHECRLVDWVAPPGSTETPISEALMPIGFDDLSDVAEIGETGDATTCWARSAKSLSNLAKQLRGLAVGGGDRIEAYILWRDRNELGYREIATLRCPGEAHREPFMRLLIAACRATSNGLPVKLPRVTPDEIPGAWLEAWGFVPGETFERLAIVV